MKITGGTIGEQTTNVALECLLELPVGTRGDFHLVGFLKEKLDVFPHFFYFFDKFRWSLTDWVFFAEAAKCWALIHYAYHLMSCLSIAGREPTMGPHVHYCYSTFLLNCGEYAENRIFLV